MTAPAPQSPQSAERREDNTAARQFDILADSDTSAANDDKNAQDVEALPPGSAMLVVKRGPNAGTRFRLDKPVTTVGRHPASGIYLDDITVSRRHAEFRRNNGEFHVVDLGSLNNTYVNRQPVESSVLASGDQIQIGNYRLVFVAGPASG